MPTAQNLSKSLRADLERLTTPREFEADYAKHIARLKDDEKAERRLKKAGIDITLKGLHNLRRSLDAS